MNVSDDEEEGEVYTVTPSSKQKKKQRKISCFKLCVYSGSAVCVFGMIILILVMSTALAITQLVIGILYKDQCPMNDKIPLYLIVSGAVGLGAFVIQCCQNCTKSFIGYSLYVIVGLFQLGWLITGSVWTFQTKSIVQYDNLFQANTYCHQTLYQCAFITIIISYVFVVYSLCCSNNSNDD